MVKIWSKVPLLIIFVIVSIVGLCIAILVDSNAEDERLLVGLGGVINDKCDSRQVKIASRLGDYLTCVRVSRKAQKLDFWRRQLKIARNERLFSENMGKYAEYWSGDVRYSTDHLKLKSLAYSSLEDGFQRQIERLRKIQENRENDHLAKLKDLIPGSQTWNQVNSEYESVRSIVNRSHAQDEARIVNRFQYAIDRINNIKQIEEFIEQRISSWPRD
jgi:hypothetical protein